MKKAFTLIELMVVVTIIAILVSLGIYQIIAAMREIPKNKTFYLVNQLRFSLEGMAPDQRPPSTHIIKGGPIDPEKNLHPINCDSLLRYLAPNQAKSLGYNDPKMLGNPENSVDIRQENLEKRLGNKWVVVDAWSRPVIYIHDGTTYRLYSVGPNGKDDSGRGDDIPQEK